LFSFHGGAFYDPVRLHGWQFTEFEKKTMPLTHTRELFAKALKGKYALGAFNVNNMELLQAIIEACEE
jgi:hypothetical protein